LQPNLVSVVPSSVNQGAFVWLCFAQLLILLVVWLALRSWRTRKLENSNSSPVEPTRLNSAELTERFVSSIPQMTRELNLEVATSEMIETFERSSTKTTLWGWVSLGTNSGSISVPVTYRYHLRLLEQWKLELNDGILVVQAPRLRASVPPAFDTANLRTSSSRGWLRSSPDELLEQMHRDLTPTLCALAEDPRRINLVRETCRQSVAQFIAAWLETQNRVACRQIEVRFPDEPRFNTSFDRPLLKQSP
jgi:hypothetical protein